MSPADHADTDFGRKAGMKAMAGAGVGGAIGTPWVAVTAVIAVPGVGVVAAGPLAAALAGVGAGALTGGLIGALVGLGMPEDRARLEFRGEPREGLRVG